MLKLPRLFRRRTPSLPDGAEGLRSLFAKFRRILDMNTRVLERMAVMEQALGGGSIFDQAFLYSSVRELSGFVHQVVYSLNAMCDDRHVDLYDRYVEIKNTLDDILGGGPGPHASASVLPASAIRWDMDALVGVLAARLCELKNRINLPCPDGFAVTTTGCDRLAQGNEDRKRVLEAVVREARALAERGGDGPLTVTAGLAEAVAKEESDHAGLPAALDRAIKRVRDMVGRAAATGTLPAVWVQPAIPVTAAGRVITSAPDDVEALAVTVAPENAPEAWEGFLLRRTYPFDPLRSDIRVKPSDTVLPDGNTPMTVQTATGLRRGSALVPPEVLQQLAEAGLAAERLFGPPQALDFVLDRKGRPVFQNVAPLTAPVHQDQTASDSPDDTDALAEALAKAVVLARGGQAAQSGAAAGRVMHVAEDEAADFPAGAVAVARRASPRLAPILRRASAMVTEVGTPAGHLATIAREARIPTLFGLPDALKRIPEGMEVTVDAAGGVVFSGIITPLLDPAASGAELFPSDPEYVTLRRLLRFIQPLHLTDPQAPDFDPAHCRSFHDIIHFAHEQAVEELLHIGQRHKGLGAVRTRRLTLDVPMDLRVLNLTATDDGEKANTQADMTPDEVRSEPFRAFLRGVDRRDMWSERPVGLRLRDLLRGMDRTAAALAADPGRTGGNLAITAPNYCNVSLRLGYHFSVLDAYLGLGPNQNSVYFRFVGGLADAVRRARRTAFVQRILESLDFTVQTKGDLVTGRLRHVEGADAVEALVRLGELTAFSRQLDMTMTSDNDVDDLARQFLKQSKGDRPKGGQA